MGIRFRRSLKLAPGVRLNVTKSGLGVTVGGRGAHYSIHSSGRTTRTFGLPGTGLYYQEVHGRGAGARTRRAPVQPARQPADLVAYLPKPGLFASTAERNFFQALVAQMKADYPAALAKAEASVASDPSAISAHLLAGVAAAYLDEDQRAIGHLEAVVTGPGRPDKYAAKYFGGPVSLSVEVKITDNVRGTAPLGELTAALLLAELYQAGNRLEAAIGLMQQLHETRPDDPLVRLSLVDLFFADKDYEAVIEILAGAIENDSDVAVETLHIRGAALLAHGQPTAAIDVLRQALAKSANRDPRLLNAVRFDRALAYEAAGQRGRARADFERVYAADPDFEDVKARLDTAEAH